MKTLLIGINSKYIHPNLAIRLLKANTTFPCDIKEFTIKDNKNTIVQYILEKKYQVIAFSCYIWNIEIIKEILHLLQKTNTTIILGGPEVSYNAQWYLQNKLCQYVIKNEGEETFHLLLKHFIEGFPLNEIPNLYTKDFYTFDKLVDLTTSKMAYDLLEDVSHKIMYIETSRGCPYKCSYCMASLDNKVRFFNIDEIKRQLLLLSAKGARIFKFLDRTFNANKKNFINLIDFIIENHQEHQSYQFEITGDLLDPEVIDYINLRAPKNLFRFEIGIQSTNINTNLLVKRIQNNEKLFSNILKIQKENIIDLHLDLIAGLPKEDFESFCKTFNDVIKLRPKELQLGFLKVLHGTVLEKEASLYNYQFNPVAPYEIISNDSLSREDIYLIHLAEEALEKYYNAPHFKQSIQEILDLVDSPFHFFLNLGKQIEKNHPVGLAALFMEVDSYIKYNYSKEYSSIHELLIMDYLKFHHQKPKAWWSHSLSPKEKNDYLRKIHELQLTSITLDKLYKYGMVIRTETSLILGFFSPKLVVVQQFSPFN